MTNSETPKNLEEDKKQDILDLTSKPKLKKLKPLEKLKKICRELDQLRP